MCVQLKSIPILVQKWDLFSFSSSVSFPLPTPPMALDLLLYIVAKEIKWSREIWRKRNAENEKDEETQRLK